MIKPLFVFIDSDVFIAACLSQRGAAFLLMNMFSLKRVISIDSQKEIGIVSRRLKIKTEMVEKMGAHCKVVEMSESADAIQVKYAKYVTDRFDVHIVAGAVMAKSRFLVTYNTKHFKREKIKREFDIIVCEPALVLQYLRSLRTT